MRRQYWVLPLLAAFAMSAASLAGEKEVRIGFIAPTTGTFAGFGKMMTDGAILALEEVDYKAGGVPVKFIIEDNRLDNELSVTKAKKLDEQDHVHVISGLVSGSTGLSVHDWATKTGMPMVFAYSAPEDITMRLATFNSLRPTWTGAQPMDPFGYWLAKHKGLKRIYMIGEDYSYPYNQAGGFKRGFYRGGGEEVKTIWHPTGTDDFSSIIAQIPRSGYDAVLYNGAGSDAVAFVKQFVEFGLLDDTQLLGQSNTFEMSDLPAMPEDIADRGCYSGMQNADNLDFPNAVKFREAYQKRFGGLPSTAAEHAYMSIKFILKAVAALGGDVSDRAKFIAQMRKTDMLDAPRGPVTLDSYGNAVHTIYLREVKRNPAGGMWNEAFAKIENISQFGPYDPETYMKQPPDTRSYPPDLAKDMPAEMLKDVNPYTYIPMK
ncbi:MAG: ABC transporter substrate-binding protein [Planctomycetota bacterium]|jgi:branched-chain amino acid transport system substrate-binding protein|nr:ABC transporter substrate-binding protein [Planctomycetota bacterium]